METAGRKGPEERKVEDDEVEEDLTGDPTRVKEGSVEEDADGAVDDCEDERKDKDGTRDGAFCKSSQENDNGGKLDEDREEEKADSMSTEEKKKDDSESENSEDGSSEESSSDDDDDDSDHAEQPRATDGEGHKMSEYELMRLERIKRNKEYLAQLGLEDGGKLMKKAPKKRSRKSTASVPGERRRSLSRGSKKGVNYAELPPAWMPITKAKEKSKEDSEPGSPRKRKSKKKPVERLAMHIHREFQSVRSTQKRVLKEAEKNIKAAEREVKHWQRLHDTWQREENRRQEMLKLQQQLENERQQLGCTIGELLQQVEHRMPEIMQAVQRYDRRQIEKQMHAKQEELRLEQEKKMQMIDALNGFPKAVEDEIKILNMMLCERAPQDPPPPRRSKRKAANDPNSEKTPKKSKKEASSVPNSAEAGEKEWECLSTSVRSIPINAVESKVPLSAADLSQNQESKEIEDKPKKKRDLNPRDVGGWVSPAFSEEINREWLQKDTIAPVIDLWTYVPQVGEIVLYFSVGHRRFLEDFPDFLGKKTKSALRTPLWEKARKAKRNNAPQKSEGQTGEDVVDDATQVPHNKINWWNEEWLSMVESDRDCYPIICRVERTHAEFPPDPYSDQRVVKDTKKGCLKVVYKMSEKSAKKKAKKREHLRLAVTLRPITPLLPPRLSQLGNIEQEGLSIPPSFSVVMFPSPLQPFLVPFTWAYKTTHSLAVGETVEVSSKGRSKDAKGIVSGFSSLAEESASFLLDDKIDISREILSKLNNHPVSKRAAIEDAVSSRSRSLTLPFHDACVIVDFLDGYLNERAHSPGNHVELSMGLLDLIRCTLPLWNGVTIQKDAYDRRKSSISPWNLRRMSKHRKPQPADGFLPPCTIDEPLRVKLECTIEDFRAENPDVEMFGPVVTDDIAPSYSCAVPVSMSLDRVMCRLACNTKTPRKDGNSCYYRNVDSLLMDLTSIMENCVQYNDQESEVVKSAIQVIPALRRRVSQVVLGHLKEQQARVKAEEEKLRIVMSHCNSSALKVAGSQDDAPPSARRRYLSVSEALRIPFKEHFYRDWIQSLSPDLSSALKNPDAGPRSQAGDVSATFWVPQAGDRVLYNRSLHSRFVKGHYCSLTTEQCEIPRFQRAGMEGDGKGSPTATHIDKAESPSPRDLETGGDLSDVLQSSWLSGEVVWVRAAFPLQTTRRAERDKSRSFATSAPVLTLGLRFGSEVTQGPSVHVVHWRPCTFSGHESEEEPSALNSDADKETCERCGLSSLESFLRPEWISSDNGVGSTSDAGIIPCEKELVSNREPPGILPDQERDRINRCWNLLKRRCLEGVKADFVDPKFCTENIKQGFSPVVVRMGTRSLPSFEHLMSPEPRDKKPNPSVVATRGISKPSEADSTVPTLSKQLFLPPWCSQSSTSTSSTSEKKGVASRHDLLSPWPKLCLEFIQLRLRNGYYRSKTAVQNDLREAYLNMVFLVLLEPALRTKSPVSIKRIAKTLSSKKSKLSASSGQSKLKKKNDSDSPGNKQKAKLPEALANEEASLVARIEHARCLYATALVAVSETSVVERVFQIFPWKKTQRTSQIVPRPTEQEQIQAEARHELHRLTLALGRDPCVNRLGCSVAIPVVKVKIMCEGKLIVRDNASADQTSDHTQVPGGVLTVTPAQYGSNEELARVFFGTPGKMSTCARCQASRRSFFECRIRRAHSNLDYDWIDNFKGRGGLDGILQNLERASPVEESSIPTTAPADSSSIALDNVGVIGNGEGHSSQHTESARATEGATMSRDVDQGSGDSSCAEENDGPDAGEMLQIALESFAMAKDVLHQARVVANAPTRLSRDFIQSHFPIDPEDGHYTYCIICGLSGNVLCCDGCSNVVHTHCVGLPAIPQGDWFCESCHASRPAPESSQAPVAVESVSTEGGPLKSDKEKAPVSTERTAEQKQKSSPQARQGISSDDPSKAQQSFIGIVPFDTEKAEVLKSMLSRLRSLRLGTPKPSETEKSTESTAPGGEKHKQKHITVKKSPESEDTTDVRNEDDTGTTGPEADSDKTNEGSAPIIQESKDASGETVPVGTRVVKTFDDHGSFSGKVVAIPTNENPFYRVRYEDGDSEEMSEGELFDYLPLGFFKKTSKRPKKRRRLSRQEHEASDRGDDESEEAKEDIPAVSIHKRQRRQTRRLVDETSQKLTKDERNREAQSSRRSERTPTPIRKLIPGPGRKRGRPPKHIDKEPAYQSERTGRMQSSRRRERTLFQDGQQQVQESPKSSPVRKSTPKPVRKRGRPRKHIEKEPAYQSERSGETQSSMHGRSERTPSPVRKPVPEPGRKRGRPRKHIDKEPAYQSERIGETRSSRRIERTLSPGGKPQVQESPKSSPVRKSIPKAERKRGRPKKDFDKEPANQSGSSSNTTKSRGAKQTKRCNSPISSQVGSRVTRVEAIPLPDIQETISERTLTSGRQRHLPKRFRD